MTFINNNVSSVAHSFLSMSPTRLAGDVLDVRVICLFSNSQQI
jgi:hypothetical protein